MMGYNIEFYPYLPKYKKKISSFRFLVGVGSGVGSGSGFFSSAEPDPDPWKKIPDPHWNQLSTAGRPRIWICNLKKNEDPEAVCRHTE